MTTLRWLAKAKNDLRSIGQHIAENNPVAAYRVVAKIETTVNVLEQHPHMGREGRIHGTRELVIAGFPYIVPYYIRDNEIRILAVLHDAREWPDDFSTH